MKKESNDTQETTTYVIVSGQTDMVADFIHRNGIEAYQDKFVNNLDSMAIPVYDAEKGIFENEGKDRE